MARAYALPRRKGNVTLIGSKQGIFIAIGGPQDHGDSVEALSKLLIRSA